MIGGAPLRFIAFLLYFISGPAAAQDTWTATTAAGAPVARAAHTAVWTGREMIVWGGHDTVVRLNTGGRYDPVTDTWTSTTTVGAPPPRQVNVAVWTGREMIVWGGEDPPAFLGDGGRYDPITDSWTPTSAVGAPAARRGLAGVWTGREMIIWGGRDGATFFTTGSRYDPIADTWTPMTVVGTPAGREDHHYRSVAWTGREMIVWGGQDGSGAIAGGGRYDPVADTWSTITATGAPSARTEHTGIWTGREYVVWGGNNGAAVLQTGARYNPLTDAWTDLPTLGAPSARRHQTAVWTGREMIVWGGGNGTSLAISDDTVFQNDGVRYDPVADVWTSLSIVGTPTGRIQHTAVWTGREMIVWGGGAAGVAFNTGARYRPPDIPADVWSPMTTTGAPAGRSEAALQLPAVWTGREMIVWGGDTLADGTNAGVTNTGGRYDPVFDNWTATTTTGAPAARTRHTLVWTGREMIAWGGQDTIGNLDTGGRYDPTLNSWTATTTVGAPAGRLLHVSVWTGREMIVWGGVIGGLTSTGGRYDPDTDTWSATNLAGAPAARQLAKAVWSGREMIVWGGNDGSGSGLNSGGRYDPLTDTWTAMSTVAAPTGRVRFAHEWTGKELLVWGGGSVDSASPPLLSDGGRYDVKADAWAPLSLSGNPTARTNARAVWTGREMIVWGGTDNSGFLNTGGRYDPVSDQWTGMTTVGAPSARSNHVGVWSGREMIVWGGVGANGLPITGGRYGASSIPMFPSDGFSEFGSVFTTAAGNALDWPDATDSSGIQDYELQVSTDRTFAATVVDSFVTTSAFSLPALIEGIYYWRVRARNNFGDVSAYTPWRTFGITTTAGAVQTSPLIPGGDSVTAYRMVSLPHVPSGAAFAPFVSALGAYDIFNWRMVWWPPSTGGWIEHPAITGRLGRAYWLISARPYTLSLQGFTTAVFPEWVLELDPGWNLVANPFNADVAWSAVTVTDAAQTTTVAADSPANALSGQVVFGYDGTAYTALVVLEPWRGYWLYNKTSGSVYVTVPRPGGASKPSDSSFDIRRSSFIPAGEPTPPEPPGSALASGGGHHGGGGCFLATAHGILDLRLQIADWGWIGGALAGVAALIGAGRRKRKRQTFQRGVNESRRRSVRG